MSDFIHSPLDRDRSEIRLLKLDVGAFAAPITCTIVHVSIGQSSTTYNDVPRYITMSYRWSGPPMPILIDGRPLYIVKNLHDALRRIRDTPALLHMLWADAICINQDDDEEKSWQVQMMAKIYSLADCTFVWLGLDDGYGENALSAMRDIIDHFDSQEDPTGKSSQPPPSPGFSSSAAISNQLRNELFMKGPYGNGPFVRAALRDIAHLLQREYWSRIWVIQEIVFSNSFYVMCGKRIIPGTYLERFTTVEWDLSQFPEPQPNYNMMGQSCRSIIQLRRSQSQGPESKIGRLPVSDIMIELCGARMQQTAKFSATDPRDVIFGILSLAKDAGELGITPNYSTSCVQLYIKTSVALISKQRLSWILCHCQTTGRTPGLPSWCPDWSLPLDNPLRQPHVLDFGILPQHTASAGSKIFDNGSSALNFPVQEHFRASSAQKMPLQLVDNRLLAVKGRHYGNIVETIAVTRGEGVEKTRRWITAICEATSSRKIPPAERLLWHYDDYLNLNRVVNIVLMGSFAWWIKPLAIQYDLLEEDFHEEKVRDACLQILFNHDYSGSGSFQLIEFLKYCIGQNTSRVPFTTTFGKMGLGLPSVKPGDAVVVIRGVKVPMILRPTCTNQWTVVGPAYIEDLMFGRPKELEKRGEYWFVLE